MSKIEIHSTQGREFYSIMGGHFADRGFIKELDNQLYNEVAMTWFLWMEEENAKGFISVQYKRDHYYIDNFYVIKEIRGKNVGKELLDAAMEYSKRKEVKAITRNEIAFKMFCERGFISYRKNGRYYYLKREYTNDE